MYYVMFQTGGYKEKNTGCKVKMQVILTLAKC